MDQALEKSAKYCTTHPIPLNERERLQALREMDILDTPAEDVFDAAVRQAASVCKTPIALISLLDRDRQWFKARIGMEARETPRHLAFCAHAILGAQLFEIPDANADARFANNPLVTGDPGIGFYAGMPLMTTDGLALGTLCVIDHEPRVLSTMQREALTDLAILVTALLEKRKVVAESTQMGLILNEAFDEIFVLDPISQQIQFGNTRALVNLGYDLRELQQMSLPRLTAGYPFAELQKLCEGSEHGNKATLNFEAVHVRQDGSSYPVKVRATVSPSLVSPQIILLSNVVAEHKKTGESLSGAPNVDDVTRLPNRRSFRWEQCELQLSATIGAVTFAGGNEDANALVARGADALNMAARDRTHQPFVSMPGTDTATVLKARYARAQMTASVRQ